MKTKAKRKPRIHEGAKLCRCGRSTVNRSGICVRCINYPLGVRSKLWTHSGKQSS
jgi:hypothetical protein